MSDPISELLEATARECAAEAGRLAAGGYIDHPFEPRFTEILRARLGPILEAGQAMHGEAQGDYETFGAAYKSWDAAWAAALKGSQ